MDRIHGLCEQKMNCCRYVASPLLGCSFNLLRFCNTFKPHTDFASRIAYTMYKAICVMQITGQWEPDPLHGDGGFFVYGKECRSLRRVILYCLIRCLPALVTVHVRDSNTSQ